MAYNELLADRIKSTFERRRIPVVEKKMMGGLTFMVDHKMCVGIIKDEFMVRIDPEKEKGLLLRNGARPMDFTGRPMKGYLLISALGTDLDEDLEFWINEALKFNPKAKSSKKK